RRKTQESGSKLALGQVGKKRFLLKSPSYRSKKLHQKARTSILTSHTARRWCTHACCNLAWDSCLCTSRRVLAVCAAAIHHSGVAAADECARPGTTNKYEPASEQ